MSAFRQDLFEGLSTITSAVAFVGDAEELTIALDIDSATTPRIQGSNAQGFRSTIAEDDWSTLTTMTSLAANDLLNIEPGFRWIRVLRETASAASLASATIAGRNVVRRGGR